MKTKTIASVVLAALLPISACAAPASTSPYNTDTGDVHVQDATSDGISQLNMVLCIVGAIRPDALVNQGPYIALVDKNKCDTSSQSSASNSSSTSSGATSAPNYINAVVDVTRPSNTSPMVAKMWMSMTDHGTNINVWALGSATSPPTSANPYGVFRMDYIGKATVGGVSAILFNGFIDSTASGISFYETDNNPGSGTQTRALNLVASSTTSGAGTMGDGATTFNFAYNSSNFRRSDGTNDQCFDRLQANADKSVWRYGTYNANDGSRVDEAHPGFPISASYNGQTYYGFASYWGINFQGLDLNTLADASPIAGVTVTDQRPGNTATYSLSKVSGLLTKFTKQSTTLSAVDGFPIEAFGNFQALTGNASLAGVYQAELHWNNTNGQFVITGTQSCGQTGCFVTPLATPVAFTSSPNDINGFSQSLGGQVSIPASGAYVGTSTVNYFTQSQVIPGSAGAPAALYCLNNCPTAASLAAFTGSNSPFDATSAAQWGSGNTQISYTFAASGLLQSGTSMVAPNMTVFGSGQYQQGIMSGKLYAAPLNSGCTGATYCEPNTDYYMWQTGPNQWNQSLWLTTGGNVVTLDPPVNIPYTVTASDDPSGAWVGKSIQLQFSGFGNLWGVPGHCVSAVDNSVVTCGPNARYVPEFALADGDTMTMGSTPLVIKALDEELRLKSVAPSTCTNAGLNLNPQTLPTSSGLHDPSNSSDPDYLGAEPIVTSAPKVIHGVLQ